jgi:hypothetical protein
VGNPSEKESSPEDTAGNGWKWLRTCSMEGLGINRVEPSGTATKN